MSNEALCTSDFSLFVFNPVIPADHISEALRHPEAIRLASELGILEILSVSLTVLGVVIASAAFFGGWVIRNQAHEIAKSETRSQIPTEVLSYMQKNIHSLMRECFKDPELASTIQATVLRLGLNDAEVGFDVDTDADRKETSP